MQDKPVSRQVAYTNRLYVPSGVHDEFLSLIKERTAQLSVGHGMEKGVTMGPVSTPRGLVKAEAQVQDALKHGAKGVLGNGKARYSS